jgi:hypothetical protein
MRRIHRIAIWAAILAGAILPFVHVARATPDFPPLDPADLKLKDNPGEPGAIAMYLYREEYVDNKSSDQKNEVYNYRLKIFTEEGKKYANVEIDYLKGYTSVGDIHGRTIHPDGTVINFNGEVLDKTVVKSGDFKIQEKAFLLPDVTPGSVIEYGYKVQFKVFDWGAQWDVGADLFTRQAHFIFRPFGQQTSSVLRWRVNRLPNVEPQKQKDGNWTLDLENIPGVANEEYTPPKEELTSWLQFYYARPITGNPDVFWALIAFELGTADENFIGKFKSINKIATEAVNPNDSTDEKLRKLYVRAQQIHNVTFDPPKTEQEGKREKPVENKNVEDVLKHGTANKLDINRFYAALVQAAGLDANVAWVKSRTGSLFRKDITDADQLDESLVYVREEGKSYYLDPGNKFCPFGLLPWYETEATMLRTSSHSSSFSETPRRSSSISVLERSAQLSLDAEGSLAGTLVVRFTGERAFVHRIEDRNEDEAGRKESLESEIKGWLPSDAKFELTSINNWDKNTEPLEVQGRIALPTMGQMAGKRMLLPMGLYLSSQRQIFDSTTRTQDIYFAYPNETADEITIQLPAGWGSSALPPPQDMSLGGGFHFEMSAKQEEGAIQIHRRQVVGGMLFSTDSYPDIRKFFHFAKSSDDQQLVLQAASASSRNQKAPNAIGGGVGRHEPGILPKGLDTHPGAR